MSLLDSPTFWEFVAGVIIVLALMPVAYFLFVISWIVYVCLWNDDRPSLLIDDPVFGAMQFFRHGGFWQGEVRFAATQSDVTIFIAATEAGPTDEQRRLFGQIEANYNDLTPEIHKALIKYVDQNLEFELGSLAITDETYSDHWTAEYTEKSDEERYMGYTVDIANWTVGQVTGCD